MTRLTDYFGRLNPSPIYRPGATYFAGSADYYEHTTHTTSGGDITMLMRFKIAERAGSGIRFLAQATNSAPYTRVQVVIGDASHGTFPNGLRFVCPDNTGVNKILQNHTASNLCDGEWHTVYISVDSSAGDFVFIVDGVENVDTTGTDIASAYTMATGANSRLAVGAGISGTNSGECTISFFGYGETYITNWQRFFREGTGIPRIQDTASWSSWGSTQPLFWNHAADFRNNLGSAGNMTVNGTIRAADDEELWTETYAERTEPFYRPGSMEYDGSTGYYTLGSLSVTGDDVTAVFRFKVRPFSGSTTEYNPLVLESSVGYRRPAFYIYSSDHTTTERRNKLGVRVQNSVGTNVCLILSDIDVNDNEWHTVFFSYDGSAGAAQFFIDGKDADDPGFSARVLTTGTLATGSDLGVGADSSVVNYTDGQVCFVGLDNQYLTNWNEFMTASGEPKPVSTTTWSGWGAQPLFWNHAGEMTNNLGSAANMTKNGTITVSDVDKLYTLGQTAPLYTPAMMRYDGSTGTYSKTYTSSGNKVTTVARFICPTFTGGASKQVFNAYGDGASTYRRHQMAIISNDHATTTRRGRVYVHTNASTGGQILQLVSRDRFDDGLPHTVFCSYDADNGTAVLIVDGVDQLDTSNPEHILTTGTMSTGASSNIHMGSVAGGGAWWSDDIGYFGHTDAYLTNWNAFMTDDGRPKALDESTWEEWNAQPLFWNEHGDMTNNLGSAGDLTKSGTIEIGKGGN